MAQARELIDAHGLTMAVSVARRIRAGQVAVDRCGPGDAPLAGIKQSGSGREGGLMELRQYIEPKAIGFPT